MKKLELKCTICSKIFSRFPSAVRSRLPFCSKSCARTYLNGVKNPSWTRDLKGEKNPMFGRHPKAWNRGMKGERCFNWRGGVHRRKDGYYRVNLNGKRKLLHRHLMEKGGVKLAGKVVHHIDNNPSNNSLENLIVYDSQSDHMKYGHPKRVARRKYNHSLDSSREAE